MASTKGNLPQVVSRDEWRTARKQLLAEEQAKWRTNELP